MKDKRTGLFDTAPTAREMVPGMLIASTLAAGTAYALKYLAELVIANPQVLAATVLYMTAFAVTGYVVQKNMGLQRN